MKGPGVAVPSPAAAGSLSPGGALEELDGTPIQTLPARPAGPAIPWHRGVAAAFALTARRLPLWSYALVAFLARGGAVVLALPIVVLPTFIGMANVIGPGSVSAGGPGPRLLTLIVGGIAAVAALALAGTIVAAAAETALHRATVAPDLDGGVDAAGAEAAPEHARDGARGREGPEGSFIVLEPRGSAGRAIGRVVVVRLALLVPVAAIIAIAVPTWIAAAYRELTLPSDVAAPLALRVLANTPVVSSAVVLVWLAAEVVGGFATRRAVLFGSPVSRALGSGLVDPLRAPVGTLLTVLLALATSVAALLPATWAVGAAWDAARVVLAGESGMLGPIGVSIVLAAAWGVALVLAGIAAAGRATLLTAELLRREPARGSPAAVLPAASEEPPRHVAAEPPVG